MNKMDKKDRQRKVSTKGSEKMKRETEKQDITKKNTNRNRTEMFK